MPDADIADRETTEQDGTILVTVDQPTNRYTVSFSTSTTHTFNVKGTVPPVSPLTAVVIESLLPNPVGDDDQLEAVTLTNKGSAVASVVGWTLQDRSGLTWTLGGSIAAGQSRMFRRNGQPMSLNKAGDEIVLLDASGSEQDRFSYAASSQGTAIKTGH